MALLGAGSARAEVGAGADATSQAIAADAQFLEYAPPPPHPGVVCLVDSGVDPNPDTNGAVIGAEAEYASWGTGDALARPLVEGHVAGHGTRMAMIMAAPQNGWGMVGLAPTSVRVYSIRVVPPGRTTFPFSAYSIAIYQCLKLRLTNEPGTTVVNLSIGGTSAPTAPDRAELTDVIDTARLGGMNVVAAAGNDGATTYPAAYPPVLAVGAGDAGPGSIGVLCEFSKGNGLDVIAPGCNSAAGGLDEAFGDDGTPAVGFGTSQASALASAALAAMRAYEPALSVAEAELCLTTSEQNGGNLDVASAFTACGLGRVVQAGVAAIPAPMSGPDSTAATIPPAPGSAAGSRSPTVRQRLVTPRISSVRFRHGILSLRLLNRPTGISAEVEVIVRSGHRSIAVARMRATSDKLIVKVRAAYAVRIRFVADATRPSSWVTKVIV